MSQGHPAAMVPNPFRNRWAAWLTEALPAIEAQNWREVMERMPRPDLPPSPLTPAPAEPRFALITSSGAYDARTQAPFAAESFVGDITHRVFPVDLPDDRIAFRHGHFDEARALADPETVLPRRTLRRLGVALSENIVSFMGYDFLWPSFIEQTIPQITAQLRADGANAALLVPV